MEGGLSVVAWLTLLAWNFPACKGNLAGYS
jgi:hypothetical protein